MSASKRAHAPGLVFAHHKLQLILARRQVEAGGVLDVLLPRLQRGIEIQLDRLPRAPDGPLHLIDDFANDVERGLVLVAALDKRNLRTRHDQRDRHIEAVFVEPEIHGVQIDRHVGGRQIAGQLLFQLLLAILACRSA